MGYLDRRLDTSSNKTGDKFGLYETANDYFFVAIREAEEPTLSSAARINSLGNLTVNSFISSGGTDTFTISVTNQNSMILALNGSVLSYQYDFSSTAITSNQLLVTLNEPLVSGDVVTYATVGSGVDDTVQYDIFDIQTPIVSGVTDGEGSEDVYYNTDTGKYEVFTSLTPRDNTNLSLSLNGATLANNIDYYQSVSNPKRIILEGDLEVNDILILFYPANAQLFGDIYNPDAVISWTIPTAPSLANGVFTIETSTNEAMTNIVYSATTPYQINQTSYSSDVFFSGGVGTTLYYRVKNEKQYESIKGDIISSEAYSDVIPITIQTNSFNSY
jgi:hypothetical protein